MPRTPQEIRNALDEIDAHMESIAVDTQAGSNVNEIAHAIHNLVEVIRDLPTS